MFCWWKKHKEKKRKKGLVIIDRAKAADTDKDAIKLDSTDNLTEALGESSEKVEKSEKNKIEGKEVLKESIDEEKKEFGRDSKSDLEQQESAEEIAAFTTSYLKLVPLNCQHIGARERQEDAFGFSDLADSNYVEKNGVLAVVADGMGGLAKGDRASQVAVSVFLREYINRQADEPLDKHLLCTLKRSNTAVYDLAFTGGKDDDLGTTLIAVAVEKGVMHWVSVGDSRIYLYRDNSLKQLNIDHIYANKLDNDVVDGLISRKEADNHPERAFLTSYLGCQEPPEVDHSQEPVKLNPGDAVLLCSDGLTNTLSLEEITAVFKDSPANIAEELVKHTLFKEKRHQDNVTILVLKCEEVKDKSIKEDKNEEKH